MEDIKIVIDAGHGGEDPGAIKGDVKEKDLNLMISKYMEDSLKEHLLTHRRQRPL